MIVSTAERLQIASSGVVEIYIYLCALFGSYVKVNAGTAIRIYSQHLSAGVEWCQTHILF